MRNSFRLIGIALFGVIAAAAAVAGLCSAPEDESPAALAQALAAEEGRLGANNPKLLPLLRRLGVRRFRDGDLAEAAALRRRALKITIVASGPDSVAAAEAMDALAALAIDRRRYLEAEPLLVIARNVLIDSGGEDDPALAPVLAGLSRVALARGEQGRAEAWAQRAVAIDPRAPTTEPLRALGAALAAEQRFDDGERVLKEALARDRAGAGTDALATARSLSQLGNLYLRQKRFGEALPLIEEAAAIDQERLGATHTLIADDYYDLGVVYHGLKRTAEAERALRAALDLLQRGEDRHSARLAYTEIELAGVYREDGKEKEAEAAFADARHILNAAEEAERKRERQV